MFSLQRQIFSASDERLMAVVHVAKQAKLFKSNKGKTLLCLTVQRNLVSVHKVKSLGDLYRKTRSWTLDELKLVDGVSLSQNNREFLLQFEKTYRWVAAEADDKRAFLFSLCKLCDKYLPDGGPAFHNVEVEKATATVAPSSPGHGGDDLAPKVEELEDYKEVSAEEERDVEDVLASCDWAVSDAENFTTSLKVELSALEAANVHAILASEEQVDLLMEELDRALEALDDVDERVSHYDNILKRARKDATRVAEQEGLIAIQNANYGTLLSDVEALVGSVELSRAHEAALRHGDLSTPLGVRQCQDAALALQEKINVHLTPGMGFMEVVQKQTQAFQGLQNDFANRFVKFFRQLTSQSAAAHVVPETAPSDGFHIDHGDVYDALSSYDVILQWLHEVDPESKFSRFSSLVQCYEETLGPIFKAEIKLVVDGFVATTTALAKSKEGAWPRRNAFSQGFDETVSMLVPVVLAEQQFCVDVFGVADDPVSAGRRSIAASRESLVSDTAVPSGFEREDSNAPGQTKRRQAGGTTVMNVLQVLFGTLELSVLKFIEVGSKIDPFNCVAMLTRLDKHVMVTSKRSAFLKKTLGKCLVVAKREFDLYINAQVTTMRETKIAKKGRLGILPFVGRFADFVSQTEQLIQEVERRSMAEKGYLTYVQALFESIEQAANESKHADVVWFENCHRLYDDLSKLKVQCLKEHRLKAQSLYRQHLDLYVQSILGDPLEKLTNFFEGVERLMRTGMAAHEVGFQLDFSKQELRKCIREYPAKEVKRGLENMHRRVERHLCEEENLLVVVWRSIQEEFVKLYHHYESLIDQCYSGAHVRLEFDANDLLMFFTSIAQSHA